MAIDPRNAAAAGGGESTESALALPRGGFLGHPVGLFLLFLVEMWERFSYYGMRALLVLYLTSPTTGMVKKPDWAPAGFNPGPGWSDGDAARLYGWYTGLAYLFPVLGGIIADKLIGTHRSMLVGGALIMLGHIALAVSGVGALDNTALGISVFIFGLALIVIGTGHFKPSVSVMVGQLYPMGDPRRDGAFSIFYMGINLGAFLCAFVCGTLGEKVGWHWGFGSAAVGMGLGLGLYMIGRPYFLRGIGEVGGVEARTHCLQCGYSLAGLPGMVCSECGTDNTPPRTEAPRAKPNLAAAAFLGGGLLLSAVFGVMFHLGAVRGINDLMHPAVTVTLGLIVLGLSVWFVAVQRPGDRGPVASIFIFMLFNAFFWLAFEQAGSSMTLFTDRYTDATVKLPAWVASSWDVSGSLAIAALTVGGLACQALFWPLVMRYNRAGRYGAALASIGGGMLGLVLLSAAAGKAMGWWPSAARFDEVPTTWFQSVNPALIFIFAPVFAAVWTGLGKRRANPSQPVKIALGLILLGVGFVVLVIGARTIQVGNPTDPAAVVKKAAMFYILGAYLFHTLGELCLSPTGLSYVTKAAPVRFVSLLMGIWFISSFIANLSGGIIAAQTEKLERGEATLPWKFSAGTGTVQADFFFLFVLTSIGAGVLILVLTPLLKRLMRSTED